MQVKFRDEARPKSGVIRVRTFIMKDAYTFDVDRAGLDKSFIDQREAYKRIFTRCGIQFLIVEASSGSMGGTESNEFMARTPAGEDLIVHCESCGYAANLEKAISRIAAIADEAGPDAPEEFPTPGVRTIEDLSRFRAARRRRARSNRSSTSRPSKVNRVRCSHCCAAIINYTKRSSLTVCAPVPCVPHIPKRSVIYLAHFREVSVRSERAKNSRRYLSLLTTL